MVKPPAGREKPWHQDHAYFNIPLSEPVVGVWIALGETNRRNGCMVLAPFQRQRQQGSANAHPPRRPVVHFMRRDWQICDSDILGHDESGESGGGPRYTRVAVPMAEGDVLLFDSLLPHGTDTNRTGEHRWALQYHFCRSGVHLRGGGAGGGSKHEAEG